MPPPLNRAPRNGALPCSTYERSSGDLTKSVNFCPSLTATTRYHRSGVIGSFERTVTYDPPASRASMLTRLSSPRFLKPRFDNGSSSTGLVAGRSYPSRPTNVWNRRSQPAAPRQQIAASIVHCGSSSWFRSCVPAIAASCLTNKSRAGIGRRAGSVKSSTRCSPGCVAAKRGAASELYARRSLPLPDKSTIATPGGSSSPDSPAPSKRQCATTRGCVAGAAAGAANQTVVHQTKATMAMIDFAIVAACSACQFKRRRDHG